ncbi:Lactoylglutathione lyase [Glycine max]|nr:Lactoylglutathione lyase [Glycine max]
MNHVSRLCRNVKESIDFYTKVLGFVLIERPQALDFEGAWLFNYGVGIHLVQSKQEDQNLPSDTEHLDPQENHISFQIYTLSDICEDLEAMEKKLKEKNVKYMKRTLEREDGTTMDQIFFNDPDGFMVEI